MVMLTGVSETLVNETKKEKSKLKRHIFYFLWIDCTIFIAKPIIFTSLTGALETPINIPIS
jgi:hypothetical protein